jgi:membrane fusion protein (multidrug efflux system)
MLVAVVIVVLALRGATGSEGRRANGQANRTAGMRLPVIGIVVEAQPFDNTIQATGTVMASEEVELRSEVSGKVISLPFREGSKVHKGDLLVKINDADLRAQLFGSRSRLEFITQKEERQRKLREINAVSEEQYEEARNALTNGQAEVALLEAQLQKTEVHAPFDGVVGLRFVSEGSYISSATLVARLQDVSFVKVDFSVPEKYAPQVRVGMEVSFTLEGTSDPFKGIVYAIEPKIDPSTRSLRVRARTPNAEGRILPGSYTKVLLVLQRIPNAILVPTQALLPDRDGQTAFVVRSGVARLIPVEAGMRNENTILILSGLKASDTLLTTGLLQLRDGSPVQVTLQN